MSDAPARPKYRRRGRARLLLGAACTVALVAASTMLPGTANAAITCTPNGADFIGYVQYDRSDSMNRDYNKSVNDQGVIRDSGSAGCQNGSPSEGTYTRGSKTPGRLMCYLDGSEAWMDWTHDSLSIYTFASRSDGNLSKLFDFWINAGPFGRPIPID